VDEPTWVIAVFSLILGASGIGALIPFLKLRQDKESSMVLGAQAAVVSLTTALKQSEDRVTRLEEENRFLTGEIEKLIKDVEIAKKTMRDLTKQLKETKTELDFILKTRKSFEGETK
jgi:predicted RNase H-like nuclease (RuvC/YqgF family)